MLDNAKNMLMTLTLSLEGEIAYQTAPYNIIHMYHTLCTLCNLLVLPLHLYRAKRAWRLFLPRPEYGVDSWDGSNTGTEHSGIAILRGHHTSLRTSWLRGRDVFARASVLILSEKPTHSQDKK